MPISTSKAAGGGSDVAGAGIKDRLLALARAQGFAVMRVTRPGAIGAAGERLLEFLADGAHGEMEWLARHADRRADPAVLWPDARSVLMLGMSYAPADDPLRLLGERSRGVVSCYARGKDYHDILKRGLVVVARALAEETGLPVKVFVDTAPLMEKPLAEAAGLGWQGKHTNLVSREHGSWLFLGAILSAAEFEPDGPEADHCGSCTRCLDICPTSAFPAPYRLDARRCIAYLTIEHKGHIAPQFRAAIGNRVFGCDDCLAVCPWNKFAEAARDVRFRARVETDSPPLADLLAMDDDSFRARFAGTPVKRTGRDRVVRNALIAAGNSGDKALAGQVVALLDDGSALVRAMAVWAASRLCDGERIAELRRRAEPKETDAAVLEEWARAMRWADGERD